MTLEQRMAYCHGIKNINNPEGNSPIANSSQFSSAATLYPDAEDLNRDNTLNETEEYFQYIVDIETKFIAARWRSAQIILLTRKIVSVNLVDGHYPCGNLVPVQDTNRHYDKKIGNIPDFKSIRFIRMFLTDFDDSCCNAFWKLQLTRNIWRKFQYKIDSTGTYTPASSTTFNVGAVNIEENDKRTPLPYRTPREIQRVQTLSNNGVNLLQNEQSMSLTVLRPCEKVMQEVYSKHLPTGICASSGNYQCTSMQKQQKNRFPIRSRIRTYCRNKDGN